ncbi:MAG TPA: sirohydrochlorin chelatase [Pseudonocardiaceae bacterium]|jgi:sirohydrochlorin ferrochelatase
MSLLLVVHGTRDPAGAAMSAELAAATRRQLAVPVKLAFADVRAPSVTEVLRAWTAPGPIVAVPAFLAAGYHVRVDLPGQIRAAGRTDVRLTAPVGPSVVPAALDRLIAAGWRRSDAVVLAAAGSADPRARADVGRAAALLSRLVRRPVDVGYLANGRPTVAEAVAAARRSGRRVAVASWLLAPGLFHQWLAGSGADVISEPIGVHPLLVAQLVRRYQTGRAPNSRPARPRLSKINCIAIR